MLRSPAFAFAGQGAHASSAASSRAVNHKVIAPQAMPFPMKDVRLRTGAFSAAAEANRKDFKTLPPDRLLHTLRLTAGLPSSAEPLGEWEKPDCELRGHSTGGHYLSVCALGRYRNGVETGVEFALGVRGCPKSTLPKSAKYIEILVSAAGFEPATHALKGHCSTN